MYCIDQYLIEEKLSHIKTRQSQINYHDNYNDDIKYSQMTSIQSNNITAKLMHHKNYENLTNNQIKREHQQLLVYLKKINQNLNQKLQNRKFSYFIKQKPSVSTTINNVKIIQQELLAGQKLLNSLNYQYRKLEIRKKQIALPEVRLGFDQQLQETKNKIISLIKNMKEIKRQNILRQKKIYITKNDVDAKQLRNIQLQFYLFEGKKDALQVKIQQVCLQNKNIVDNLEQINYQILDLEQNVKNIQQIEQHNQNLSQLYQIYKSKIALIQSLGKKRDLYENNYKKQYYQKLKKLQMISNNSETCLNNIALTKKKIELSRKEIQLLNQKLNLRKATNNKIFLEDNLDHIGFMVTEISDVKQTNRYDKQDRIMTQGNQIIKIKSNNKKQLSQSNSNIKYLSQQDSYEYSQFEEYIQEQTQA